MKHQFGWDLPPGVSVNDIEDAQHAAGPTCACCGGNTIAWEKYCEACDGLPCPTCRGCEICCECDPD